MLDKIPAIMIDPAVVIDTRCDPAGLKVVFSDGTSKVLTCVGGGGGPTPTAVITVNGGQTANVTPSSNLSVRVQGVAAGTSIQWAGTGTSVSDPLIASLTSLAGSASSADFTVNVPVGTAQRVITFTASVGGTQVAAFTVTVAATATDFQVSATASLNFASGSTTAQQASISLTNIVGNPGSVSVTVSAGSAPVTVSPTSLSLSQSTTSGTVTVTPTAGAASGTYSVTVTATNGTTTRTATISVEIAAAAPSFTLSVSPASMSFASGSTTGQSATVSISGLAGGVSVVSVATSASGGFTVSPANLNLSSSTTSGTFTVTPAAGTAAGTYTVSITASGSGVTRMANISLTVAAPSYAAPTMQFLTEPGMPANEISLHTKFGLRITNIYKGSGVQLILKGWNAGPALPQGTDLDLTQLLTDPAFDSYYNATTKTLEWPTVDGLLIDLGWLLTTYSLLNSAAREVQTITSANMPLTASVRAPDGVVRNSPPVNVKVRKAVSFVGTPLTPDQSAWNFNGGVGGTMQYNVYAPRLAGQSVGFFWSFSAFQTVMDLGIIPASGVLNYPMVYPAEFPDNLWTYGGAHCIIRLYTYTGGQSSPSRNVLLGTMNAYTMPAGGPADVPPALQFRKRNGAQPIELRWYNGSTPLSSLATSGSYGPAYVPDVYQDDSIKVPRSAVGSTVTFQIKNLHATTTSGSCQFFLSGRSFDTANMPSYNEFATVGNSTSGNIYLGVNMVSYNNADVTFTIPMNVFDAAFTRFAASEIGTTLWVGAYLPSQPDFKYYLFGQVAVSFTV